MILETGHQDHLTISTTCGPGQPEPKIQEKLLLRQDLCVGVGVHHTHTHTWSGTQLLMGG